MIYIFLFGGGTLIGMIYMVFDWGSMRSVIKSIDSALQRHADLESVPSSPLGLL